MLTHHHYHKIHHLVAGVKAASALESCDWWQLSQQLERHVSTRPALGLSLILFV